MNKISEVAPTGADVGSSTCGPHADDEISLLELARILWTRRWWAIGVAVAGFGGATTMAVFDAIEVRAAASKEPVHEVETVLRLGILGSGQPIMSAEEASRYLQYQLLPEFEPDYWAMRHTAAPLVRIELMTEEPTRFVSLASRVPLSRLRAAQDVQTAMAQSLIKLHEEMVEREARKRALQLDSMASRIALYTSVLEEMKIRPQGFFGGAAQGTGPVTSMVDEPASIPSFPERGHEWSLPRPNYRADDITAWTPWLMKRVEIGEGLIAITRERQELDLEGNRVRPTLILSQETNVTAVEPGHSPRRAVQTVVAGTVLGLVLGIALALLAELTSRLRAGLSGLPRVRSDG